MSEASRVQKLLNDQEREIAHLKNRIESLEAALREILATGSSEFGPSGKDGERMIALARAALGEKKDE